MVRKSQEWPDEGELIVGTVYKVLNYGAFAKLEEYQGKEAFIHISEVSSGWVKNAEKFLELSAKSLGKTLDEAYDEVGYELMDIFGDVYGAFETAADEGAESLTEEGIPQDWADAITEVAKKNITPPEVHISGYVDIETFVPNGVEVIISALKAAEDNGDEEEEIKVQCVGAPRYRITVKSTDYILAEKALKAAADRCIAVVEESEGNGAFLRELDN